MELKTKKIDDLILADYNPRAITKKNLDRLRASIKEFGFSEPVVINSHEGRENVIIAGHMRVRAAKMEGLKEVPCVIIDIDPSREKALNIALNNENLRGMWDEQKLSEIMVGLNEEDVNLKITGFKPVQIRNIVEEGVIRPPKQPRPLKCPKCGFDIR